MRIVLLGPPGAGKGTQAGRLAGELGMTHVASGDLFRKHQAKGTELGIMARSYMERGELVPDDVTIMMVMDRIEQPDATIGYILDGFPRTVDQAKALDEALKERGDSIDHVPLIQVETEELVRRLSGRWLCNECQTPYHEETAPPTKSGVCDHCGNTLIQRKDDQAQIVRRRLQTYQEQTLPLIDYYQGQQKLAVINGHQSVDEVAHDLVRVLNG